MPINAYFRPNIMTNEEVEFTWLDAHQALSFNDLLILSGLSQSELITLVEQGALVVLSVNETQLSELEPNIDQNNINNITADSDINTWLFNSQSLVSMRTLCRLKADFELEDNGLSLIMIYLERIRLLEAQLQQLGSQK